jgi:hypothetical protein
MKNFIIGLIALFFSSAAYADSYLVYNVTDGTRVVINEASCLVAGLHGKRAVVQRADGAYIRGCWEKIDGGKHVKIVWDNPAIPGDFAVLKLVEFYPASD